MHYRKLGTTGLKVSEIGFGSWAIGGPTKLGQMQIGWGKVEDEISLRTLETCLDLGINFIDTADVYGNGHSEELIGKTCKNRREQVVICTKGGNRMTPEGEWVKDFSQEWIKRACEKSLQRLQTDYVDIYLYHTPRGQMKFLPEEFQALEKLKSEGKIRFYGVSIGPVEDGLKILECDYCGEVIETVYNILERDAEEKLFPSAQGKGVGIIDRIPLCSGFLTGKFKPDVIFPQDDNRSSLSREVILWRIEKTEKLRRLVVDGSRTMVQLALQFCLANSGVSVVIPGAKTPQQLSENAKASELEPLTSKQLSYINKIAPFVRGSEKTETQYAKFFKK